MSFSSDGPANNRMWTTTQAIQVAGVSLAGTVGVAVTLVTQHVSLQWVLLAIASGLALTVVFWSIARWSSKKKAPEVGTVRINLSNW